MTHVFHYLDALPREQQPWLQPEGSLLNQPPRHVCLVPLPIGTTPDFSAAPAAVLMIIPNNGIGWTTKEQLCHSSRPAIAPICARKTLYIIIVSKMTHLIHGIYLGSGLDQLKAHSGMAFQSGHVERGALVLRGNVPSRIGSFSTCQKYDGQSSNLKHLFSVSMS